MPAKKTAPRKTTSAPKRSPRATVSALAKFEESFAKEFGDGVLIAPKVKDYDVISTGSLTLDEALGCGGTIPGRITEIWGPPNAGKTTMAMITLANYQQRYTDRIASWIDVEHSWDNAWAEAHGVDLKRVRVTRPGTAQDVADHAKFMVRSGLMSFICIDSIGGMIGRSETEKDADEAAVAEVARVVTRMVKQQAHLLDIHSTGMWIINQPRSNIGSYGGGSTTGGGNALKHVSTHKIRMRLTATKPYMISSNETDGEAGFEVAAIVERNKVAPPKKVAVFGLFNQHSKWGPLGIDRASEALQLGIRYGIITNPAQGSYQLPDREKVTRGQDKVLDALRESPELVEQIRQQILTRQSDEVATEVPVETDETDEVDDVGTDEEFGRSADVEMTAEVLRSASNPQPVSVPA
jgi:recombination protein RecA